MRIRVFGDCATAIALKGNLSKAGFRISKTTGMFSMGYTLHIQEYYGVYIHVDGIDCELERNIVNGIANLTETPILLQRAGGVQSDQEIRIRVPMNDDDQKAVELGVVRGMLRTANMQKEPSKHLSFPKSSNIGLAIVILAILMLFTISLKAQQLGNTVTRLFSGVPTNPCTAFQIAKNASNGHFYSCNQSTLLWVDIGPSTGGVTNVTATSPILSSGGATPDISCPTCLTTFPRLDQVLDPNATKLFSMGGNYLEFDFSTDPTNYFLGVATGGTVDTSSGDVPGVLGFMDYPAVSGSGGIGAYKSFRSAPNFSSLTGLLAYIGFEVAPASLPNNVGDFYIGVSSSLSCSSSPTLCAGVLSDVTSGTNNWAFYGQGTAASHFGGATDAPIFNATTGFKVNGAGTSGRYLKGDGTNFVISSGSASGVGSCTNQAVTALNSDSAPTCSTVTSAYTSGSFPYDPLDTSFVTYKEEFGVAANASGTIGELGWKVDTVGSAPNIVAVTGAWPNLGIIQLTTTVTAGQGGTLSQNSSSTQKTPLGLLAANDGWDSVFIFKLSQTTNTRLHVGYGVESTGTIAITELGGSNPWFGIRYDTNATATAISNNGITRTGGVVTVSFGSNHQLNIGQSVVIAGATGCGTDPNGTFTIRNDAIFRANKISYTQAGADETCGGAGATATGNGEPSGHFQIETINAVQADGFATVTDTGVAADTNWHKLRLRSTSAGTILFTLYDSTGAVEMAETSISTTVDGTVNYAPMFQIVSRTGAVVMQADYWGFKATGLSR